MRLTDRSLLDHLEREEREFQRRLSMLRRPRSKAALVMDLQEEKSGNFFNAALEASSDQHGEVVRKRLADKGQALAEALGQIREGTYGLCRVCGERIPRRRLEVLPTATLCVPCQEQRETVGAAWPHRR